MYVEKEGQQNILFAEEGMHIRDINDVYTPATEEEPEHFPYYAIIIYLANNFDVSKVDECFVEEPIGG